MSLLGLERSLADQHQSYPFCPESGLWARLGLPFPAFPLLQAPALSATCAHWHLPQPCLLRAPPGSGLGCEVGESARPAVPFLASSWLLTPCGALISSWRDPCTAPIPVAPPLRATAFGTTQFTSILSRQRTKMSFSLLPTLPN